MRGPSPLLSISLSLFSWLSLVYMYISLAPASIADSRSREARKKKNDEKKRSIKKRLLGQACFSLQSVISPLFEARGRDAFLHLLKRKVSAGRNTLAPRLVKYGQGLSKWRDIRVSCPLSQWCTCKGKNGYSRIKREVSLILIFSFDGFE